ncbi:MAG: hypothetical protein WBX29_01775, partial [Nitrososphaeraceae archaeon]
MDSTKHKSYLHSIINIVKSLSALTIEENSVYPLTFGIQDLNGGKYAQMFPNLYYGLQKDFPR